jgi:hypothetical protein
MYKDLLYIKLAIWQPPRKLRHGIGRKWRERKKEKEKKKEKRMIRLPLKGCIPFGFVASPPDCAALPLPSLI